jgi:hypothetical protein
VFGWGTEADPKRVREELADILTYCLLLAGRMEANPEQNVLEKLEITRKKYSVDKGRGSSRKYDESMMNCKIAGLEFSKAAITTWNFPEKHGNWPVVYVLDDGSDAAQANPNKLRDIYVGESLNDAS